MKTAIFLGAGASSEDGAPLQSEIFNKYFTGLKMNGERHTISLSFTADAFAGRENRSAPPALY
jgi:hypothetical protein